MFEAKIGVTPAAIKLLPTADVHTPNELVAVRRGEGSFLQHSHLSEVVMAGVVWRSAVCD